VDVDVLGGQPRARGREYGNPWQPGDVAKEACKPASSLQALPVGRKGVTPHPGFAEFYEEGFAKVYRAAFVLSNDREVAEEATQEAFARVLERWNRIGQEPWAIGWVMTTALNLIRRTRGSHRLPIDRQVTEFDADSSIDLRIALRSLSRRQQEAVLLHYEADMSVEHVAASLRCRVGTVKTHLWRARQQLARSMRADDAGR
jgi:RNA polymerase sigma-70 factor (ECF subfamily)